MTSLFDPIRIGDVELTNRIVMAPLTRGRSGASGIPGPMVADYYAQRADAGLLISEATAITERSRGWRNAPGIYTDEQIAGWRRVTDAVHERGSKIFVQLWHMGRTVLPEYAKGELPLAPSEVKAEGGYPGLDGTKRDFVMPRPMTLGEIETTRADFVAAAERAVEAGFDGVEIHGANGYLLDTFLRNGANRRQDEYGGSVENRARFLIEVVEAVVDAIGPGRVGVRLSPTNNVSGIWDSTPDFTFPTVAAMLNRFGLAYLHVLEPKPGSGHPMAPEVPPVAHLIRRAYGGTLIINGGLERDSGDDALKSGLADAVAFGVPFIANPDLVQRFRRGQPLSEADPGTYFSAGRRGYTDYPEFIAEAA